MPANDVAIVAPYAGAVYEGRPAGGAEIQSAALVRALAGHGVRVAHVVRLDRLPDEARMEGVSVVPIGPGYERGGVARRRALVAALRSADAAVYVQRSAGFETGVVGLFARATRRRFVFSASSDANFRVDADTARLTNAYYIADWKSRLQYRVGLRCASAVVVQTRAQGELARRTFAIDATVIPSFVEPAGAQERSREGFLWVGAIVGVKDPLAYVRLAATAPTVAFRMIATERLPAWHELAAEVRSAAAGVPNLTILEPRPRSALLDLYGENVAVVNTSRFEGFPNTFLEGWARATPALSLAVDPDDVIAERRLGVIAHGSLDALAEAVVRYARHSAEARAAGDAALQYVEEVHAPEVVGPRWVALVERVLARRR